MKAIMYGKARPSLELESLEFANLLSEYLQTDAEAVYQKSQLKRLELLVEKKIRSQRDLEKTQADYTRANAAAKAAYSRLLAVGVQETQIERWKAGEGQHPHLKILSPLDGYITEHLIDMGQAVTAYQKLGVIVNPQKVMIKGYVSPEDGALIKPGDKVVISKRSFSEKKIENSRSFGCTHIG